MHFILLLWVFLQIKGSKADANANCKVLTPDVEVSVNEDKQTTGEKRKRKANKKLFADEYVTNHDGSDAVQGEIAATRSSKVKS